MRDWFWEIEAGRHGPDAFFAMAFEPDDAPRLISLVRSHIAENFVLDATNAAFYNDARTHQKLVAQRESGRIENIWVYSQIRVINNHFEIEAGFCGMKLASETALIVALARSPELSLRCWSVAFGGQGYSGGTVAGGEDVSGLLKYLQAEAPTE